MGTRIALIHGFNEKHAGARNIDTLEYGLTEKGYEVDKDSADYGYLSLIKVRSGFKNPDIMERLVTAVEWADVILAHSNGGNYGLKALDMLGNVRDRKVVILFSPAVNRNREIPLAVRQMFVMHTKGDGWVRLSGLLLFHDWGLMGCFGYNGGDPRGTNLDQSILVNSHSGYFKPKMRQIYVDKADKIIRSTMP